MTNVTPRYSDTIQNHYTKIDNGTFFGLLRNDRMGLEKAIQLMIIDQDKNGAPVHCDGHDYYVKRLKSEELINAPPKRFVNVVQMRYKSICLPGIVEPIGIVLSGRAVDIMQGRPKEGYFISTYVKGPTLMERIRHIEPEESYSIFRGIGIILEELRLGSYFLLDFAPRDIVLRDGGCPVLMDTENMDISHPNDQINAPQRLIKKQIAQFRKDYKHFLSRKELDSVQEIIFKNVK